MLSATVTVRSFVFTTAYSELMSLPPPPHPTAARIAAEICSSLRTVLRLQSELYTPINRFVETGEPDGVTRYYVQFDAKPRKPIKGLRYDGMEKVKLADESIQDRVLELASAVWQLKEPLQQYAQATQQPLDMGEFANKSPHLLVTADLANLRKHGQPGTRSNLNPRLDRVAFDTSGSGAIEYHYDGRTKQKELIVSKPTPLRYGVKILVKDGKTTCGDAGDLLNKAFDEWMRVVKQLGVLKGDDAESRALRLLLMDD